jgi:hypothetical protein
MTPKRFWLILDKYEKLDLNNEYYIPNENIDEVVREITTYDKTFEVAEGDAFLMWKGKVPEKARKLLIEHYTSKKRS